jgi:hypothetical protein
LRQKIDVWKLPSSFGSRVVFDFGGRNFSFALDCAFAVLAAREVIDHESSFLPLPQWFFPLVAQSIRNRPRDYSKAGAEFVNETKERLAMLQQWSAVEEIWKSPGLVCLLGEDYPSVFILEI